MPFAVASSAGENSFARQLSSWSGSVRSGAVHFFRRAQRAISWTIQEPIDSRVKTLLLLIKDGQPIQDT